LRMADAIITSPALVPTQIVGEPLLNAIIERGSPRAPRCSDDVGSSPASPAPARVS
jgi:hypothetical protein